MLELGTMLTEQRLTVRDACGENQAPRSGELGVPIGVSAVELAAAVQRACRHGSGDVWAGQADDRTLG